MSDSRKKPKLQGLVGFTKFVRRLRSVFWERIPQERVEGKRSVWSESDELLIDLSCLDELFQQSQVKLLGVKGHCDRDKHASKSTSQDNSPQKVCILGERSSLKVGIFMHHVKSNLEEIISDIREGRGQRYGTEKLRELYKLLPDSDEEQRLRAFKGEHSQLEEVDLFMLHLVLIPSYRLRLEAMILQEEFDPAVTSLSASARCLATAAAELMRCAELHSILRLVLKAANYMNTAGCVGEAAGFRISSLLKLADTKANRPGMTLLHYVAMEAVKKDPSILSFQHKLKHVGPAARLSVDLVQQDFSDLQMKVAALLVGTDTELHTHITPFLQDAKLALAELQEEVECVLKAQRSLQEFLCEDDDGFRLEEVCTTFTLFTHRFIRAAQENELREQEDRCRLEHERVKKAEKRHSIISCSALEESNKEKDALEIILRTPMDPPRRRSLHSTSRTLLGGVASRQPIKLQSFTKSEASKNKAESLISIAPPPTEANQTLSPSPKPTSSNSPAHFPSLHCLHVGETHALVPSLLSYSSLAPPTRRDHTHRERKEKKQEVTESKQEVTKVKQEVIKKEVESVAATKPHRGKLNGEMTKSTNQTPPRRSRLPLLRTSSKRSALPRPLAQSECVKECPIREAEQYKRPHPLSQLLERTGRERQEVRDEEQEVKMEEVKKIKEQEVVRSRSRLPIRLASPLASASQSALAVPLTELSTYD